MEKYKHRTLVSVLSYLLIGIIIYGLDEKARKDKLVKFHVKQGIVFLITVLFVKLLSQIISSVLWVFAVPIIFVLHILVVILLIIGVLNASNEKFKELPVIGSYSKKIKL